MAKRGNSGDRVLESKHVIGLFLLMLLFSGVFFTLGYVMGRNQLDGQVRAATNTHTSVDEVASPQPEIPAKRAAKKSAPEFSANSPENSAADSAPGSNGGWGFYENTKSSKATEPLHPVAASPAPKPVNVKAAAPAKTKTSMNAPLISSGAYVLQVAALTKEGDALALANTLQKKKFPAIVLSPQADKFYRVQVGPYADQKAADAAKKGLEGAGFKAIVKH
jgi:cell division septation protein DedD